MYLAAFVSGGVRCARPLAVGLNAFGVTILGGERRLAERSGIWVAMYLAVFVSGGVRCARPSAIGLNAFGVAFLRGSVGLPSVPAFGVGVVRPEVWRRPLRALGRKSISYFQLSISLFQ